MLALIMEEAMAQALREATGSGEARLDPRRIDQGEHAGRWLLWASVREDFPQLDALSAMTPVPVDPGALWPESAQPG